LCGFFSVKRKLFILGSALQHCRQLPFRDSHSTGVKPPKMFLFVSSINIRVFAWQSQRS
jgi:hypothetical protein